MPRSPAAFCKDGKPREAGTGDETTGTDLILEPAMLFIPTQAPIPPFAALNDGVVARLPHGSRFAFLMTMFRDVDDRPYLKQRASQLEKAAGAAMAVAADR
jgi:hypothetical protein